MKILRIVPSINPKEGGVAEAVRLSAKIFQHTEVCIEVLCFDEPEEEYVPAFPSVVHAIGKGFSGYHLSLNYLKWLMTKVKNYDLVIIDGLWQFHTFGGYLCKLKKVPYAVYTHGMLDPYFNQFKLKYLKKLPFWFLIERNIIHMAQKTIFTCEEEKVIAKNAFPLMKSNDIIVTLGIEKINKNKDRLSQSFLDNYDVDENKKIGLYLSRIHLKKGIDILIDVVYENKNSLKNYLFVIAGTGDKNLENALKERIKKYKIEENFLWTGHISGDVKWGAFNIAEFFILPSHSENFGIVVAEALSESTPVISTNKVNIWREIDNYKAGCISNDDKDGVSNAIKSYLDLSEGEKEAMKKNALICFENAFSIGAFKKDFDNLIEQCKV